MTYDHFINQVQHRARLASRGQAVGAIRATLETLAERLGGGEVKDLASQLPREIAYYLLGGFSEISERFDLRDFIARVAHRENVDFAKARFHAQVVLGLLSESISRGEWSDIVQRLPDEFVPILSGRQFRLRRDRRAGRRAPFDGMDDFLPEETWPSPGGEREWNDADRRFAQRQSREFRGDQEESQSWEPRGEQRRPGRSGYWEEQGPSRLRDQERGAGEYKKGRAAAAAARSAVGR